MREFRMLEPTDEDRVSGDAMTAGNGIRRAPPATAIPSHRNSSTKSYTAKSRHRHHSARPKLTGSAKNTVPAPPPRIAEVVDEAQPTMDDDKPIACAVPENDTNLAEVIGKRFSIKQIELPGPW